MRFPLSRNKMSCFCIQNFESQRKHSDSDKHTKKTDKHMKKNHIDIERNKTVAMVHVPADSEFVFEWVFLPCVCFWCRLNMFQRGRIYHLSVTVHDNQVSLGIRIARPPRGVCKLTQHFDSSTW